MYISDAFTFADTKYNITCSLYSSGAPMDEVVAAARDYTQRAYPLFVSRAREVPDLKGGYDHELGVTGRPDVKEIGQAQTYREFLKATEAGLPSSEREFHMKKFVEGWLEGNRKETTLPIYNNDQNKHNTYVDYWCWEAMAASVVLGIDDRTFRDHPNYPKDFADWVRVNRS